MNTFSNISSVLIVSFPCFWGQELHAQNGMENQFMEGQELPSGRKAPYLALPDPSHLCNPWLKNLKKRQPSLV
jgi:hypothetical protein